MIAGMWVTLLAGTLLAGAAALAAAWIESREEEQHRALAYLIQERQKQESDKCSSE